MTALPADCLAVRQPWAWAIIHAGKPVENRSWKRWKRDWQFRGRVAILAAKGMTKDEYEDGASFMRHLGIACPPPHELVRGAIIGSVEIHGHTFKPEEANSSWFFGPGAFLLRYPTASLPVPAQGQLDIFKWKPSNLPLAEPAKWMLPKAEAML